MRSSFWWRTAAVTLLLGWAGAPVAQAAPVDPAGQEKARQRLLKAVTVEGVLKHEEAFARIAKRNDDTRASGTPGYGGSVNYVTTQLKKAGYKVTVQPFTYRFFEETAPPTFRRTAPKPKTFTAGTDFLTMEYSGSDAVAGALVPTNDILIPPPAVPGSTSGCEAADFPAYGVEEVLDVGLQRDRFLLALDDDLDTPTAIEALTEIAAAILEAPEEDDVREAQATLRHLAGLLGLTLAA